MEAYSHRNKNILCFVGFVTVGDNDDDDDDDDVDGDDDADSEFRCV